MKDKIKILSLTHYTKLYGANKSLLNLIEGLESYPVEIQVVCPIEGQLTAYLKDKNKKYHIVRFKSTKFKAGDKIDKLMAAAKWVANWGFLFQLKKIVKSQNIDFIHSNSSVIDVGVYLSKQTRKPHIWHIREFGEEDYGIKFFPNEKFFHKLLKKTDAIITISEALNKTRIPAFIPNSKKYVLYNGVISSSDIEINTIERLPALTFNFAIIGRLQPSKGQLDAIKAFNILKKKGYQNIRLFIAGDGEADYISKIQHFIDCENLVESVTLLGYLSKIDTLYQQTDVLLMCSKSEGMGRVTVEAMAKGIPVIGYKGGATPELIIHGESGFLYSEGINELEKYMEYLLLNKDAAKKMGINGKQQAKDRFTLEAYAKGFYDILSNLTKHSN